MSRIRVDNRLFKDPCSRHACLSPLKFCLKSARRRVERTTSPRTLFSTLNCFGPLPTTTIHLWPPPKSHSTPHLTSPHLNLALFGKLSTKSYTELQIAPYPYHPLWLPYYSYVPHTSLIKSQSNIFSIATGTVHFTLKSSIISQQLKTFTQ